jgi:hypothetical protein
MLGTCGSTHHVNLSHSGRFACSTAEVDAAWVERWTHVAVVVPDEQPSNWQFYIDGSAGTGYTDNTGAFVNFSAHTAIGDCDSYTPWTGFNGMLDDLRIYSIALDAVAVGALAAGGEPGGTNPIHHWQFSEGTGPGAADSAGGRDAVLMTPARMNGALALGKAIWAPEASGAWLHGGYARVPNDALDALDQGTVAVWVMLDAAYANFDSWLTQGPHLQQLEFAVEDGLFIVWSQCGLVARATAPLSTGVWYHLAYTTGPAGNALYVDGAPAAVNYEIGNAGTQVFFGQCQLTDTQYWIGSTVNFGGEQLMGEMDLLQIYDRPLTAPEIASLFAAGR